MILHARRAAVLSVLCLLLAAPAAEGQLVWNQAAAFAGTASSYLVIPDAPELDCTAGFTIECWVNVPTVANDPILVQHRLGSADEGYTFYLAQGKPAIRVGGTTRMRSTTVIPTNQWVHLLGRYNPATGYYGIYINGAQDTSGAVSTPAIVPSSDSVRIGTGFNDDFLGLMDEVRIWNRPVSETSLLSYHIRTSFGASGGIYDGLVLSLTFQDDELLGTFFSTADWSGQGNTAVNRGVTAVDMSFVPSWYLSLNEAVVLDGDDDFLAGPDAAAVSPTSAVTLEAWVFPRATGIAVIVNKGRSPNVAYRMVLSTGNTLVGIINSTTATSTGVVPEGRWSHVAFTYASTGSAYTFTINGEPAGSGTLSTGAIIDSPDSVEIGGGEGLVDFTGLIDEVRISGYVKTPAQIRQMMFVMVDGANEPSSGQTNVVYGFNGYLTDVCTDGGPRLVFNGGATFSTPARVTNTPVAPLGRVAPAAALPAGYRMKTAERRIPEAGSTGDMIADSIYCSQSVSITDLDVFVALNHTFAPDLDISITAPNGDTAIVCADWAVRQADDNIIAVFDDQADSAYTGGGRIASIGPHIRPGQSFGGFTGGNAQGWWILHIRDDQGGDSGRLYGWGLRINNQTVVGVGEDPAQPLAFRLAQNYPNPFNPVTVIEYDVPRTSPVTVEVFDILGRLLETPVNEVQGPGTYRVNFTGAARASGTYFYRLTAGAFVQTRKMILIR